MSAWMTLLPVLLSAFFVALLVTFCLLWPLRGRQVEAGLASQQLAQRVYKDRLAELNNDLNADRISSAEYANLKLDLDRGLLADAQAQGGLSQRASLRWLAVLLLVLVPVSALSLWLGHFIHPQLAADIKTTRALAPTIDQLLAGETPSSQPEGFNLADFVRTLQRRIQQEPLNAEAWSSLGMAFLQAREGRLAQEALARAVELSPGDENIALTYVQASVVLQQGEMDPMAKQILQRMLALQPDHHGALLMMGMGSLKQGDKATAVQMLTRLQTLRSSMPAASSDSQADARIAELLAQATATSEADSGFAYRIEVTVADDIARQLPANSTLFVSAREPQGMPMPIAARRLPWQGNRMSLSLSAADALSPERPLERFKQVVLQARISTDGNATGPGWEAVSVPASADTTEVIRLRISEKVGNP